MKQLRIIAICLIFVIGASALQAEMQTDIEYVCGEAFDRMSTNPNAKMRIVFVRFPGDAEEQEEGRRTYPDWAIWLEQELSDFVVAMSRGTVQPDVEIVRDPANPSQPWTANSVASVYAPLGGQGPTGCRILSGALNVEIMTTIDAAMPGYWSSVDQVFVVQYDNAFACHYNIGGWGAVGVGSNVPGFVEAPFGQSGQHGTTAHLWVRSDIGWDVLDPFDLGTNERVAGGQAHEFAHALGRNHNPVTGNPGNACASCGNPPDPSCQPLYVNMGRYSALRGVGPSDGRIPESVGPIHAKDLIAVNWLPEVTVSTNMRDFHVPQIRDASNGLAVRVVPSNSPQNLNQHFLLANHQGILSSRFDANYQNAGLLVWHILPNRAWDLESARGKTPDAETGMDPLEQDWCHPGSGGDFFDGSLNQTDFSAATNPNSNLYVANDYGSAQSIVTQVGVENIRQDPLSTDMIVDIYVDPTQYVNYPNGGEFVPSEDFTVTWQWRDPEISAIETVDVELSVDGGQTWPVSVPGVTNTGSYTFSNLSAFSDQAIVRVKSYDSVSNASDVSDAEFTIWDIIAASVTPVTTVFCHNGNDLVKIDVAWETSIATDAGGDRLEVYFPSHPTPCSGAPSSTITGGTGGTSHQLVWQGPCQTGLYAYRVVSNKGTGETVSDCGFFYNSSCPSCSQCPPPGCELSE